jgi:hypothetical protein
MVAGPAPRNDNALRAKLVLQQGRVVEVVFSGRKNMTCVPTPGARGIQYLPEWFGLTAFG